MKNPSLNSLNGDLKLGTLDLLDRKLEREEIDFGGLCMNLCTCDRTIFLMHEENWSTTWRDVGHDETFG